MYTRAVRRAPFAFALAVVTFALSVGAAAPHGGSSTPSAARIAFGRGIAADRFEIWTVEPDGSGLRQVTKRCYWDWWPAWAPDGRRIAFSRSCNSASFDLYIVNADGSGLRRLTRTTTNDEWPTWSPDGRRIAFVGGGKPFMKPGETAHPEEIYVVNTDGTGLRRLTKNGVEDAAPAWSPDGRTIVFTSRRSAGTGLWAIPAAGGEARFLRVRGGEPAWSPDGRRIAFARAVAGAQKETTDLYVMNADGTHVLRLTSERLGVVSHHPSWSPDGRSIVFMSNRVEPKKGGSLWIVRADGSGMRRLTRSSYEDVDPAWSADRAP